MAKSITATIANNMPAKFAVPPGPMSRYRPAIANASRTIFRRFSLSPCSARSNRTKIGNVERNIAIMDASRLVRARKKQIIAIPFNRPTRQIERIPGKSILFVFLGLRIKSVSQIRAADRRKRPASSSIGSMPERIAARPTDGARLKEIDAQSPMSQPNQDRFLGIVWAGIPFDVSCLVVILNFYSYPDGMRDNQNLFKKIC